MKTLKENSEKFQQAENEFRFYLLNELNCEVSKSPFDKAIPFEEDNDEVKGNLWFLNALIEHRQARKNGNICVFKIKKKKLILTDGTEIKYKNMTTDDLKELLFHLKETRELLYEFAEKDYEELQNEMSKFMKESIEEDEVLLKNHQ